MKKLIMMLAVAFAAAMPLMAETETVGDYTWTYQINGDTAEIYNYGSCAIAPNPSGAVTIPSTLGGKPVTRIGEGAFYYCSGLTSVTIPDCVTNIGEYAFLGCSGLTSVTFPDSVTSIGWNAFSGCRGLTSVMIGSGVKSIWYSAFSDCSGLTSVTIPDSVTSIDSSAFSGCRGLTSVTIPNSVTNIGASAFYNCSGLTSVTIGNGVTSIGDRVFSGCSGLTSVTIPESVTSISGSAFSGCSGLTSVTIPNSVKSIGASAFSGCNKLTDVTIPQIVCATNLASYFPSWQTITNVVIADGVGYVADSAFAFCTGLKSVTFSPSVTRIGEKVFSDCNNLLEVNFLGDAPDVIGADVFIATRRSLMINVPQWSIGWDNGFEPQLPESWNGRRIAYLDADPPHEDSHGYPVAENVRYDLTDSAKDRSIASVTVNGDTALDDFVLADGKVYDSVLYVVNTAATPVRLTLPAGHTYVTVSGLAPLLIPASSTNLVTVTRMATDTFLVTRQNLEAIK